MRSIIASVILVVLLASSASARVQENREKSVTLNAMRQLRMALEGFRQEYGVLPSGDSKTMIAALAGIGTDGQNPKRIPFFEFRRPTTLFYFWTTDPGNRASDGALLDGWRRPFVWTVDPTTPQVTVRSLGANGRDDAGADDDHMMTYAPSTTDSAASSAEQLAKALRIDRVHFRAASLQGAVDYLQRKAIDQFSGQKLRIYYTELSPLRLTFHFRDRPLYDSLSEIAHQTGLPLHANGDALYFGVSAETSPVAPDRRTQEEDSIREAVFRYLFRSSVSSGKVTAFSISIDERDPTDAFLARFRGHQPPARKASEASDNEPRPSYSVEGLQWLSNTKAEIHANSPDGHSYYEVTHTTKGWRVSKDMAGWIP